MISIGPGTICPEPCPKPHTYPQNPCPSAQLSHSFLNRPDGVKAPVPSQIEPFASILET